MIRASDRARAEHERRDRQILRVERRHDDDGAEVADDRDGGEQDLERQRRARAEQREHSERECDVGGRRNRPTADRLRFGPIERRIDQGRPTHAAQRRDRRQKDFRAARELAFEKFALDLEPDEQ
jgi:hypothetical protein